MYIVGTYYALPQADSDSISKLPTETDLGVDKMGGQDGRQNLPMRIEQFQNECQEFSFKAAHNNKKDK